MKRSPANQTPRPAGGIPYRLALAGGWIDQPFVSRHNPEPPGSMVVVSLEPEFRFMDRSGMATGTREIAKKLWRGRLPSGNAEQLVRKLYAAENKDKPDPSGSQDMIGLIYPGMNRLDYDFATNAGVFPSHIEPLHDPISLDWLEQVLHLLPIGPRPDGYNPLGVQRLKPAWVARLGQTGRACFDSIRARDLAGLGASFNECMKCWEAILPQTVKHPSLTVDLKEVLREYQRFYSGAMYSGCGGGYLFILSEQPVPGTFQIRIRRPD